jgi:hypothetical protein
LWSDAGYIGIVGDGMTYDTVKSMMEIRGTRRKKEAYKQIKIFDFEQSFYHLRDGANISSCSHLG